MANKKVLGTTPKYYNGIHFKSTLECSCYKKLEESGLQFEHESERISLLEGFYPNNINVYIPNRTKTSSGYYKYDRELSLQKNKIRSITYTPDFLVKHGEYLIYFDAKGKENDVFPLKKKMFLKYLENKNDGYKYMFFEPHSVKQMLQAIEIIKNL